MIEKEKLFGIVIWFNPSEANICATDTYVNEVNKLIIIDNSAVDNSSLIEKKQWTNVIYCPNYENKGIATALNQGCRIALSNKAEWVLTMDQDSFFDTNGVETLIQKANLYHDFNNTAIFSPRHIIDEEKKKKLKIKSEYTIEDGVMTSGNILSLKAYQSIGNFLDELFIDLVDVEYCIRITKKGFHITMINDVMLHHFLGNGAQTTFLGFKKTFYNHPPIREYYIARNSLYVAKLHKDQSHKYRKHLLKQIKRIILYDHSKKYTKLLYITKGILDYRKGITGLYQS
jgi:Predicted glycosyltransferases